MLLVESCKGDGIGSFKKRSQPQPIMEGTKGGTASEEEMLSGVDPLLLDRFEEGGNPTAEHAGSFKEIDPVPLRYGGFCGSDPRQASTDNA